MRDQILQLVRDYPGLHLRELARQIDTSLNLIQYHVQRLETDGFLELGLDGGKVRVFPPDLRDRDRIVLGVLRGRKRCQVVMVLLDRGESSLADLAKAAKVGKSTLSFHLRHMVDSGVLANESGRYSLQDPKAVRALLDRYPPTPDAADRMADLWAKIYRR